MTSRTWKLIHNTPKMMRYIDTTKKNRFVEIYHEQIHGKRKWFIDLHSRDKIFKQGFNTKKETMSYYMKNR